MSARRIPPTSEAAFKRDYFIMWMIVGAVCLAMGLIVGPLFWKARYSWFPIMVALAVYLFSLLLCRVVLMSVWRKPHVTPAVLYFSIPLGGVALIAVVVVNWLSTNFSVGRRIQYGLGLAMALLYGASLIWGVFVGVRRKRMGSFEVDDRR